MGRPAPRIRVIAIGLHWKGRGLLATEVREDSGDVEGMRPMGGGAEFGETWKAALIREFTEELGAVITVPGPPLVLENIYAHEGAPGHEVVFAAPIQFEDPSVIAGNVLHYSEDNGTAHTARWFDLDAPGAPLYPDGLRAALGA